MDMRQRFNAAGLELVGGLLLLPASRVPKFPIPADGYPVTDCPAVVAAEIAYNASPSMATFKEYIKAYTKAIPPRHDVVTAATIGNAVAAGRL